MRAIILAAGQGFKLDGFNKILIRDPRTEERIMDQYLNLFKRYDITVVVGYKAINIMNEYPQLHYVYNASWRLTHNSYSLGLAMNDEPCFVLSSDLFIDPEIIKRMESAEPNCILTCQKENRILTSLNCSMENRRITNLYQGPLRDRNDPEAMGIYKISDRALLRDWKIKCLEHTNLFLGQNLDFKSFSIFSVEKGLLRLEEVNAPLDYIAILNNDRTKER